MAYPKLHPEQWKNSKLTLVERDEIDFYVNHAGWSIKRVAEMYHVTVMTVKYWSNPEYKAKDNARTTLRLKRNMEDPAYRKRMVESQKKNIADRVRTDPVYAEWIRNGRRWTDQTPAQREGNRVRASNRYISKREDCLAISKRTYRMKNDNGFRMFWQHINKALNADNICPSKKETRSTKSSKTLDVSHTKSHLPMVRKLHTSLLSISRKMLRPISVLKRVFSIRQR
jgi:hypothetical protein